MIHYRTFDDYRRLRGLAAEGRRFVVTGAGFIGSEIAAALAMNGCRVTLVFPGTGIGSRVFPADLAAFVTDYYREQGVDVLSGESVVAVEPDGEALRVGLDGGRELESHGVVAGLGIEPAVELAEDAGLTVEDGIAVDSYGRVLGREDVFAAGDVARFPSVLGGDTRIEHVDHATSHGRRVGETMAGADEPYDYLPYFFSDLFDLGYEAVGEVDSRHETVADWREPNREGVVYYLDGERRVRGVLLWNVWDKREEARELILAGEPVDPSELTGRI